MDYTSALSYVHSLLTFGSKPGLSRVSRLVSLVGNPQNDLKFIHFAGTSGKGSTALMTASILQKAGYKVGLYTSPFVLDFRERFKINGQMIEKDEFAFLASELKEKVELLNSEGIIITEFEFITALSFMWFKKQNCDVVCLEVGMGGRFDATNIIKPPLCSVITSIGLDHTAFLGDSIDKIAFEKCGIIKEPSPVCSYPLQKPEAFDVIKNICAERNCKLNIASLDKLKIKNSSLDGSEFEYKGQTYKIKLLGEHQIYNALNALTAIEVLEENGFNISSNAKKEGLLSALGHARVEVLSTCPIVLIDGAHNEDKVKALYSFVKQYEGRIVSVCGMLKDKDFKKSVSLIAPLCRDIFTVTPDNPRALENDEMAKVCEKYCQSVKACDSIESAVKEAFKILNTNDVFLAWGSLYIAGEIRKNAIKELNNRKNSKRA